jgi:hypothetical protein
MEATTKAASANGAGAAQTQSPTLERIEKLRALAASDPVTAQSETWQWFQDAGKRIASDRDAAIGELEALFNAAPTRTRPTTCWRSSR